MGEDTGQQAPGFAINHHKCKADGHRIHDLQKIRKQLGSGAIEQVYNMSDSESKAGHKNGRFHTVLILAAYREFSERVKVVTESTRKPNRVRDIIKGHLGKITKAEIMQQCPDVSQTTIQRALNDLVKSGEVIKIGGGRYTSYTWNREID